MLRSTTLEYLENPETWVHAFMVHWTEDTSDGRTLQRSRRVVIKALKGSKREDVAEEVLDILRDRYPWRTYLEVL